MKFKEQKSNAKKHHLYFLVGVVLLIVHASFVVANTVQVPDCKGDANGYGGVNKDDVDAISQYSIGRLETIYEAAFDNADINNDRQITIEDALLLEQELAKEGGKIDCLKNDNMQKNIGRASHLENNYEKNQLGKNNLAHKEIKKCVDNDKGTDPYQASKTLFGNSVSEDYCENTKVLREYFCQNAQVKETFIECEYGCKKGACLRNNQNQGGNSDQEIPVLFPKCLGDFNGDAKVNQEDVQVSADFAVGLYTVAKGREHLTDMNSDNQYATATDTLVLQQMLNSGNIQEPCRPIGDGYQDPQENSCQGCLVKEDNTQKEVCIPVNTRLVQKKPVYCAQDGTLYLQNQEGQACQNDVECISGSCKEGFCGQVENINPSTNTDQNSNIFKKMWNAVKQLLS